MMRFAEDWVAAWNRRDIDAVLAHFAEDAQFTSPIARSIVGRAVLRNRQELADYWRRGLERIATIEFRLDHATWDQRCRELVVVYEANLNGEKKRACEIMRFDAAGRQVSGEAMYGAVI
jgi:steroid delta-isomerase